VGESDMTEPQYSVVRPVGRWAAEPVRREDGTALPRRVGFVWDHIFRGDEMFTIAEQELRVLDSGLTFVGYEAFGDIHGPDAASVVASLPTRLKGEEVDAVIVGVGA
jgi:hypothetical protein